MSSGPPPKSPYSKPWLSVADQVARLEARGLQVNNRSDAESFLRTSTTTGLPGIVSPSSNHATHSLPVSRSRK